MPTNQITLRPATRADLDFLDELHSSAMRPHVERTHAWNPFLFRETFDVANSQVIQFEGKDIGYLKIRREPESLHLADIQLLEEYRNRGIGTWLIERILHEASQAGLSVWLRVLKGNPAMRLYQRLGFKVCEEADRHHCMAWPASRGQPLNIKFSSMAHQLTATGI